jgi:hypothetical protein
LLLIIEENGLRMKIRKDEEKKKGRARIKRKRRREQGSREKVCSHWVPQTVS